MFLSSRWTMPGRRTPPIARQAGAAMGDQRVDERARRMAGAGWTTSPAGLSMMMQMLVLVDDGERQVLAGDRRVLGRRHGEGDLSPSATRAAGSRASAPSTVTWPASISAFSRVRERASPRAAAAWLRKRSSRSPPSPAPMAKASRSAVAAAGGAAISGFDGDRMAISLSARPDLGALWAAGKPADARRLAVATKRGHSPNVPPTGAAREASGRREPWLPARAKPFLGWTSAHRRSRRC